MTDEQKDKPGKAKRPGFGGISQQYATVGGAKKIEPLDTQEASNLDAQIVSRQDVEQANRQSVQPSSIQNSQEVTMQTVQAAKQLEVQEASNSDAQMAERPKRRKLTVYVEPDVDRWIRHRIADTDEEYSQVVNLAVRRLMEQK